MGKARTLEIRNELPKAIDQYRLVAKQWPGSPEAEEAQQIADKLQGPQAAAFYKELYAYSPTKMTLPPLSTENLPDLPVPAGPVPVPVAPMAGPTRPSNVPFGPSKPAAKPAATRPAPVSPTAGTGLPDELVRPSLRDARVEPKTQVPRIFVEPKAKAKAVPPPAAKPEPAKPAASQNQAELPPEVFSSKAEPKTTDH